MNYWSQLKDLGFVHDNRKMNFYNKGQGVLSFFYIL